MAWRRVTARAEIPDQLYIKLYPDQLAKSPAIEHFVQTVWQLVGSNNLPNVADDNVRPARVPSTRPFLTPPTARLAGATIHLDRDPLGILQAALFLPRGHLIARPRRRHTKRCPPHARH